MCPVDISTCISHLLRVDKPLILRVCPDYTHLFFKHIEGLMNPILMACPDHTHMFLKVFESLVNSVLRVCPNEIPLYFTHFESLVKPHFKGVC